VILILQIFSILDKVQLFKFRRDLLGELILQVACLEIMMEARAEDVASDVENENRIRKLKEIEALKDKLVKQMKKYERD
jgi:hypothetical protein